MGIGGLDKEFSDIFRRAFASRVFPPDIVEQMGEGRTMVVMLVPFFLSLMLLDISMLASEIFLVAWPFFAETLANSAKKKLS